MASDNAYAGKELIDTAVARKVFSNRNQWHIQILRQGDIFAIVGRAALTCRKVKHWRLTWLGHIVINVEVAGSSIAVWRF